MTFDEAIDQWLANDEWKFADKKAVWQALQDKSVKMVDLLEGLM